MSQTNKKNRIANSIKGLKGEFSRIIWPSRNDLIKESVAVIVVSIILGSIIAVVDSIFKFLINLVLK